MMPQAISTGFGMLLAGMVLAGCIEPMPARPDAVTAPAVSAPPEKGTCALRVSGLMPTGGPPSLQGNACHLDDLAHSVGNTTGAVVVISWGALQPSLGGRVEATVEGTGCSWESGCSYARTGGSSPPLEIPLPREALERQAGDDVVVRIYPEGYSFQQPFRVRLVSSDDAGT
jgi:hypothetical protein